MKGREKMFEIILNILKCLTVFLLIVAIAAQWYENAKQVAESEAQDKLEAAIKEAGRPVVKVEIQTKGDW